MYSQAVVMIKDYGAEITSAKRIKELEREQERAYDEASKLAMYIWSNHYRDESPDFELCDSTAGVISQIDNMITGLLK